MIDFVTKDSGARQDFSSGARRDISTGKPRYDLLSLPALRRWADLMGRGAEKYGARNWEKGMPTSRMAESALRHLFQYLEGDRTEDHAAAVLFNVAGMIHFEGTQWDDLNVAITDDDDGMVDFFARLDSGEYDELLDEQDPWLDDDNLDELDETCYNVGQQILGIPVDKVSVTTVPFSPKPPTEAPVEQAPQSMVNWTQLRLDVADGKIDGETVRWPTEHEETPQS